MLRALHARLWVAEHPMTLYGVHLGARMTLVQLEDGTLWAHSPIPLDEATKAEIDQIGPVQHVVAPNQFHHLHAVSATRSWPGSTLYAAPGLAEKIDLTDSAPLSDTAPAAWRRQIDQHVFAGMPKVNEVLFFHRDSKTLIVTDLFFNLRDLDHWWSRTFLRLNDAYDRFGMSRFYRSNIKDQSAARASADRVLSWDFDRVILSHGQILETGGRDAVAAALAHLG